MTARKLTFVLLAMLLVPLSAARAETSDPLAASALNPARLTKPIFIVQGRGWGHGIGLSQWGAQGLARAGYTFDRILAHYYRGTTLGPAPVKKVRVLVAEAQKSVVISSTAPFSVEDGAGLPHQVAAGKYTLTTELKLRVDGEPVARKLIGPLAFTPGAQPLALDRPYRGTIQIAVLKSRLQAVNSVGLEQYLYGVVPGEMPHTWLPEALKAQAVAARSYALSHLRSIGAYDLYADTRSQVYRGIDEEELQTTAAINATAAQVLLYRGKVASTYFHSTSGGRTASIEDAWPGSAPVPYLVSVPDPYDSISPHHRWGPFLLKPEKLARVLKVPGRIVDATTTITPSQRVTAVIGLGSEAAGPPVPATDVRRELELRSTWFTLSAIALERPARPIAFGTRTQLRGIARGVGKVLLERRAPGEDWVAAGTTRAAADGSFAVRLKPKMSTFYRLALEDLRSPAVRVAVAPFVRLRAAAGAGGLRGVVRPALPGNLVTVQRLRGTAWKPLRSARVDDAGRFEAALILRPGSYRARVAPGLGLAAGTSAVLTVPPA